MVPAHEPAQTESLAVTKNTTPKQLILLAPVICDSLSNTKSPFQRPPYLGKPRQGARFKLCLGGGCSVATETFTVDGEHYICWSTNRSAVA